MKRLSAILVCLASFLVVRSDDTKSGQSKALPAFEELENAAKNLAKNDKYELIVDAEILLIPDEKNGSIEIRSPSLLTSISSEYHITAEVTKLLMFNDSYSSLLSSNKAMAEWVKSDRIAIKKYYESAMNQKEPNLDFIINSESAFSKMISSYAKEKGYRFIKRSQVPRHKVKLITEPPNGKIYLLSVVEYELAKLRKIDADRELKKYFVSNPNEAELAGVYYFMIEWDDGKTTKPAITTIPKNGSYTLR